jgi:Rrf2 family iron-sulfur cluster assembly transcriptional regulator
MRSRKQHPEGQPKFEGTMRLTTKGRFAVTAMIDLALRDSAGPVTLADISQRQKISLSYLEQLFGRLRRQGLVNSTRGPGGGYRLAREPLEVSVAEIIIAVDEPIDATQCGGRENCHDDHKCLTHDLWTQLNAQIFDYLKAVTLAQLVAQQRERRENGQVAVLEMPERRTARSDQDKAPAVSA